MKSNKPGPVILRPSLRPPENSTRERGGGDRTIPMAALRTGSTTFPRSMTIFAPGAATPLQLHNREEHVPLPEGDAVTQIDSVEHAVAPFDVTFIPAGILHRIRSLSADTGMPIRPADASIDATRTPVATGGTRKIDEEHRGAIAD